MADTLREVRADLHRLDLRLTTLEAVSKERHDAMMERLDKLAEDLSDAGRTPEPTDRLEPKPRLFGIVPGTGKELAGVLVAIATFLTASGLIGYTSGQSGGFAGAKAAVEDAVEQAEAVPVAAPVTRVVPVPVPVPVPVEPEPLPIHDDLMPLEVP